MSQPIIAVENLSKKYRLGEVGATTLREDLSRATNRLFRRQPKEEKGDFWALRDVSFSIFPGEVIGIIGRNGAGKSTLLKVLSRITEPTSGRAILRGRVASLLEVGTGFHLDLSGRDNIYLYGAILGMKQAEIRAKYDEIVAFAEVGKFIDTPVKHYSSGMYVRLAFAVAAHLEPDILIVDEVLAVGDTQFQDKCLGKMEEVSRHEGRTVLFVSHHMGSIHRLCRRVLMLERGQIAALSTDVQQVIQHYLGQSDETAGGQWINPGSRFNNPHFRPVKLWASATAGGPTENHFTHNQEIWINVTGDIQIMDSATSVGIAIVDEEHRPVFWSFHHDRQSSLQPLAQGTRHLQLKVPSCFLNEGRYRVELMSSLAFVRWLFGAPGDHGPMIEFKIGGGFSSSPYWIARRPGAVAPVFTWNIQ